MKKIVTIFVLVICCIACAFTVDFAITKIKEQAIVDSINDDKYTQDEYLDFQKQLSEKTFYYYNNLSEHQKDAYVTLYYSSLNFDKTCKVQLPIDEIKQVITAIIYDNSNIFWLSGNYTYLEFEDYIELTPEYLYGKVDADKISKNLKKRVDEIINNMPQGINSFEKELYLHDYICKNTVYDEATFQNGGDTAHSSLLIGRSICEGYARAMQTLLDAVRIDNYLIVGDGTSDGKTEAHMWNIVNIDGNNYHLDVTWNDGVYGDASGYFYFNVTDQYILRDHSNLEPRQNNCLYNYANYFVMKNTYISIFSGFDNLVTPTANILKSGENRVEFLFKNKSDFNRALNQLDDNSRFFDYVAEAVTRSGRNLSKSSVEYFTTDEYYYLCIVFKEE